MNLILLLLFVIAVEAITEILVESEIFRWPRETLARANGLIGTLVHCGYCTSVWVSAALSWAFVTCAWAIVPNFWVSFIVTTFVLHRLSNLWHELTSKWLNRRPITFAVHKTETVIMPGVNDEQENG